MSSKRIILASASPRRSELLESAGICFSAVLSAVLQCRISLHILWRADFICLTHCEVLMLLLFYSA